MSAAITMADGLSLAALFDNLGNESWLTTKEAAYYLRISVKFLLNLTSNGRVPYYKLGRSNRYLRSELKSLLLTQSKGAHHGNRI